MKAHTVTFLDSADATAVALAKIGASTNLIAKDCHLSPSQISYRLSKAQRLEQTAGGYRRAWRNGESKIFRMVRQDTLAILRKEVMQSLPQKIEKTKLAKSPK